MEEEIQMHADSLYHRLLKQEAEVAAAKEEGRPIPTFPPLLSKSQPQQQSQQQQRLPNAASKTTAGNIATPAISGQDLELTAEQHL